ncbi:MAG: DUF3568 family protein [Phycisphaerales bacterium]|nr:DUF3568 family protein [Phycisphaerales bacterium]
MNRYAALAVLAAAPVLGLAGCQGKTDSGQSYTMTIDRRLEAMMPGDLKTVHAAAEQVLKQDMGYTVTTSNIDALSAVIEGRTARDNRVKVESFKDGDRVTKVRVGVDPAGDELAMRSILDNLARRLK